MNIQNKQRICLACFANIKSLSALNQNKHRIFLKKIHYFVILIKQQWLEITKL